MTNDGIPEPPDVRKLRTKAVVLALVVVALAPVAITTAVISMAMGGGLYQIAVVVFMVVLFANSIAIVLRHTRRK